MLLSAKITTLLNTGVPDYNICGQATSNLSFSNLSLKIAIGKNNGTTYTVINTTDLSTFIASGLPITYTYGNYDVKFTDFNYSAADSTFQAKIELFFTGTTDVVTWERFNVFISISKSGYEPFYNTFEFYNYDVGNSSGIGGQTDTTGNTDFEIQLVNDTNNLDSFGRQTKPASHFMVLRRPFTEEIHIYNMLGTQGNKSYSDTNGVLGYGDRIKVDNGNDVLITQTLDLPASYCTSQQMAYKKVWWPTLITTYSSLNTCDNCTNTLANTEVNYSIDAGLVSVFNLHGVKMFLTEYMSYNITIDIINYNSDIVLSHTATPVLTYALWTADPTPFLNPTTYSFVPPSVGENVIKITELYFYDTTVDIKLYECVTNYDLTTCHWWTVTAKDACGQYTVKNCSNSSLSLTVQMMNADKTFTDLSTTIITSFSSLDITLSTDGIYILKMVQGGTTEYYSLPSFCIMEACLLKNLNKVICNPPIEENCKTEDSYNFNALLILAHSYFLAINQEMSQIGAPNYIYASLSTDKINDLYTLKTLTDRIAEYCEDSDSPCIPCNT